MALVAYAALFSGNCGGESLNGSGTGGKGAPTGVGTTTGAGGSLEGSGGFTGTGDTLGTGGLPASGSGGDGIGAGGDLGNCNAILTYPPLVTVVDISNGGAICDPTFAIVNVGAFQPIVIAGVDPCDGTTGVRCLGAPPDGGPGPCRFALTGLGMTSGLPLEVSAPGYLSSTAYNVMSGVGGCVPYSAASQITVALFPSPADAGLDAH